MARLTPRQIIISLRDARKDLPQISQQLQSLGDQFNELIDARDRIDVQLAEQRKALADVASTGDVGVLNQHSQKIESLLKARADIEVRRQSFWKEKIDFCMQPIGNSNNAAAAISPLIPVLQEHWVDMPEKLQRKIHEAIGSFIEMADAAA